MSEEPGVELNPPSQGPAPIQSPEPVVEPKASEVAENCEKPEAPKPEVNPSENVAGSSQPTGGMDLPDMMMKKINMMINQAAAGVYSQIQLMCGTPKQPNRAVRIVVLPDIAQLPKPDLEALKEPKE